MAKWGKHDRVASKLIKSKSENELKLVNLTHTSTPCGTLFTDGKLFFWMTFFSRTN